MKITADDPILKDIDIILEKGFQYDDVYYKPAQIISLKEIVDEYCKLIKLKQNYLIALNNIEITLQEIKNRKNEYEQSHDEKI